jgi:hypothetical protein
MAIYKDEEPNKLPLCTKEIAVRIILGGMLTDEKAIIFSMFIDVINVYAKICKEMGLGYIIIKGSDKEKALKSKLNIFENGSNIRVLLTTLQKSAEGYKFPFATHVIIMELWWNPQKIIQAMGRIDRKSQTRNIFIYILCYCDENKNLILQEDCFYETMNNKLEAANIYFQENENINPKMNPELVSTYRSFDRYKKVFNNVDTFSSDLKAYINQFAHTKRENKITFDFKGHPIEDIWNALTASAVLQINYLKTLEITPWHLGMNEVNTFCQWYCHHHNLADEGRALAINLFGVNLEQNYSYELDYYYHCILFDKIIFKVTIQYVTVEIPAIYLICKKTNGKYELIGIYFNSGSLYKSIYEDLLKRGVKKFDFIIAGREYRQYLEVFLPKYFPKSKCQVCLSKLVKYISLITTVEKDDLNYIDSIFSSYTYESAYALCHPLDNSVIKNIKILKILFRELPYIHRYFKYEPSPLEILCKKQNIITGHAPRK